MIWKIVILLLAIAAVLFAFRAVGAARKKAESVDESEKQRLKGETMEECRICGTFVAPKSATDCGRDGCPYGS